MSRPYRAPHGHRRAWNKRQNYPSRGSPRERGAAAGPEDPEIMRGLKETPLGTVPVPVSIQNDPNVTIAETAYLGSYDWTARSIPTIVVPGEALQLD